MSSELIDVPMRSAESAVSSGVVYNHTGLLANAFFAAVSIYLSGIYDYSIDMWDGWGIPVPTLAQEVVQCHVITILSSITCALERTNISQLLYLFPLRVAGARCTEKWERDQVLMLLRRVGTNFVVARAFETELGILWGTD